MQKISHFLSQNSSVYRSFLKVHIGKMPTNAPIRFINNEEKSNKSQLYIPWTTVGRHVDDGINDSLNYEKLSNIPEHVIGRNGKFLSRCDQRTVVSPETEEIIVKSKIGGAVTEQVVKVGENVVVNAGIEFTIIANDPSHITVLNRKTIGVGKLVTVQASNKLPADFSDKIVHIVDCEKTGAISVCKRKNSKALDMSHSQVNIVDYHSFPGSFLKHSGGVLENTFTMEWQNIDDKIQVHFKGLGGVLKGGEGNPGVVLIDEKQINVNLLLKRVDGSFYLDADNDFLMIVANSTDSGDPDVNTLQAAKFSARGVKLPYGYWHSVPIPLPGSGKLHLNEFVADTNANAVINVAEETGKPLHIQL